VSCAPACAPLDSAPVGSGVDPNTPWLKTGQAGSWGRPAGRPSSGGRDRLDFSCTLPGGRLSSKRTNKKEWRV